MANTLSQQEISAINQQLASNPGIQALLASPQYQSTQAPALRSALIQQELSKQGIQLPHDYSIDAASLQGDGPPQIDQMGWFSRNQSGLGKIMATVPLIAGAAAAAPTILGSSAPAAAASPIAPGVAAANAIPTTVGLGGVGGTAATGGILNTVGHIAPILGGAAKDAAQSNQQQDQTATSAYGIQEATRLNRDKFALDAPRQRMSTATRGDILSRVQPTKINWGGPGSGLRGEVPTTTGGYRDALAGMTPGTRDLGGLVASDMLASQKRGGQSNPNEQERDNYLPPMPKIGEESPWDKILGGAAFGSSILGAF